MRLIVRPDFNTSILYFVCVYYLFQLYKYIKNKVKDKNLITVFVKNKVKNLRNTLKKYFAVR